MDSVKTFGLKPIDKVDALGLKAKNIGVYLFFTPKYKNEKLPKEEIYLIDNTKTLQQNIDILKMRHCFPIEVFTNFYTDNIEYSYDEPIEDKFKTKSLFNDF